MRFIIKYLFLVIAALSLQPAVLCAETKRPQSIKIVESQHKDTSAQITDYYLSAVTELNLTNDTLRAFAYCKRILELDSLHAPSLYMLGSNLRDSETAVRYVEKAVELAPDNIWYKFQLSTIYGTLREYNKSLNLLEGVVKSGRRNPQLYRYITALHDIMGNEQAAQSTLDSALTLYGDNLELLSYKGELLKRKKLNFAYVANAERMVACSPNDVMLITDLAIAYQTINKDSLAEITFKSAYRIDSLSTPLQIAMVEFYERKNQIPTYFYYLNILFDNKEVALADKIDYYNKVIKNPFFYQNYLIEIEKLITTLRYRHEGQYDVDNFYAQHMINIGKPEKAVEVHKAYLDRPIDYNELKDAYNNVIGIENYLKRPDSVFKYISQAIDKFKTDTDEPLYLSYMLKENGREQDAIDLLNRSVKRLATDSLKSMYYCTIADIYQAMGDKTLSFKTYEISLKYDPDNIVTLNNYAYFLSESNEQLDKALEMSARVLKNDPSNATYLDTYAWILYLQGKYSEAKGYQMRAVALDTTSSDVILLHYAEILSALGDKNTALLYYRKAIDKGASAEELKSKIEALIQ